jgi:hypothetical protein
VIDQKKKRKKKKEKKKREHKKTAAQWHPLWWQFLSSTYIFSTELLIRSNQLGVSFFWFFFFPIQILPTRTPVDAEQPDQ